MDKRRVEDILVDKRRVEDILVSFVQTVWCYCLNEGNG